MPRDEDDRDCFYVDANEHPGLHFMVEHGRLARVDASGPDIATSEGIHLGDTEARALEVYGRKLRVEPSQYDPEGHFLTVHSSDGRYGVRFETNDGKIENMYAGTAPAIKLVEGCS